MTTPPLAVVRSRPAATRAALGLALCLGLCLTGGLVPLPSIGSAAAVTTNQSYWTPAGGTMVVRGHGFGHGHGMSQYGAQGAARRGLTYRQIIDFYYPKTSWSTVTGKVRVLVTADTSTRPGRPPASRT